MTRVVGTAGHIDHGKTTLLRALTGIDADRLPEERRRGLTIDVGYAHMVTPAGWELDFVDVPGHDRLVGNMLVGAGEVDACLLVVAADDGPRAQTLEHVELLDALALSEGVAVVTKRDLVPEGRAREVVDQVRDVLAGTALQGVPVLAVSAVTGEGLDALVAALEAIAARPAPPATGSGATGIARLAVDRAFHVRGRGTVVTGTARGAPIERDERLVLVPSGRPVRVRGVHVHDRAVDRGPQGGRVALLLAGVALADLRRGQVLVAADGPSPVLSTRRMLVALRQPRATRGGADPTDGPSIGGPGPGWGPGGRDLRARLHIGTDQVEALAIVRGHLSRRLPDGTSTALLRCEREVAAAAGDRFVLRRPPPAGLLAGGLVLDPDPPPARPRRRFRAERLGRLAVAVAGSRPDDVASARTALHGITGERGRDPHLADDVEAVIADAILEAVAAHHAAAPAASGMPLTKARGAGVVAARHATGGSRRDGAAAGWVLDRLVTAGRLRRDGDAVAVAGHRPAAPDPARAAAMERLVAMLDTDAPPSLRDAAARAGCAADALRELERDGRIVVVEDDLAWSRAAWERLAATALSLAREGPLSPAALRDATGTSRKFVMALLEDLQRRGMLTRSPGGHVPGPRA